MMKQLKRATAFIAAVAATGAIAFASSGLDEAPTDAEALAMDYIEGRLENPRGASFRVAGEPYPVYADVDGYEDVPAWAVDVRARMRLAGGGTGSMPYTVIFVDGEPIALDEDDVEISVR